MQSQLLYEEIQSGERAIFTAIAIDETADVFVLGVKEEGKTYWVVCATPELVAQYNPLDKEAAIIAATQAACDINAIQGGQVQLFKSLLDSYIQSMTHDFPYWWSVDAIVEAVLEHGEQPCYITRKTADRIVRECCF